MLTRSTPLGFTITIVHFGGYPEGTLTYEFAYSCTIHYAGPSVTEPDSCFQVSAFSVARGALRGAHGTLEFSHSPCKDPSLPLCSLSHLMLVTERALLKCMLASPLSRHRPVFASSLQLVLHLMHGEPSPIHCLAISISASTWRRRRQSRQP